MLEGRGEPRRVGRGRIPRLKGDLRGLRGWRRNGLRGRRRGVRIGDEVSFRVSLLSFRGELALTSLLPFFRSGVSFLLGASQLPSRPPPASTHTSSSSIPTSTLNGAPSTPTTTNAAPSRVPGRPAWNPAPSSDSPSRTNNNNRDRDDHHHHQDGRRNDNHHHRRDRDDDESSVPSWMAEESTPATSKTAFTGGEEKEDEIQRFKREMKERDLRSSGRRPDEKKEVALAASASSPAPSSTLPTSLSIGGFEIPFHATSPSAPPALPRPDLPRPTTSSTSIQSVLLPQASAPPQPPAAENEASGGRRGGSRFAKFFVDGKPKAEAPPVPTAATPAGGDGGGLGALLGGMAGGGGAPGGDNQMSKLLAMLQSSKVRSSFPSSCSRVPFSTRR